MASPIHLSDKETPINQTEDDEAGQDERDVDDSPSNQKGSISTYKLPERLANPQAADDVHVEDIANDNVKNSENEPHATRTEINNIARSECHSYNAERSPSYTTSEEQDCETTLTGSRKRRVNYKAKLILHGHRGGVSAVKYSPDGHQIASCSADGTVKTWDAKTGKHGYTFEAHLAGVSTIAWSPNSDILASGSDDKTIRLWYTSTGKPHSKPFVGHHNYIYSLAFSPKGNMIVSGSYDETIFIWDVRTARVLRSLPAHADPVGGVDFVRDGTLIVSCSSDGLIRIWDTATGQCLRTLIHEDNVPVVTVRFSPNGKYVLAWTLDNCLRLWNYVEGRCVKTYQGHRNIKYSLGGAFGVYGEQALDYKQSVTGYHPEKYAFIASGSEDGSIYLWNVSSKELLQKLEGHADTVLGVDTHPKEQSMVSCSLDRTIKIWQDDEIECNEVS